MSKRLFKKPDGSFVRISEQYAADAVKNGYQPATEAQFKASQAPVQAAAESFVGEGLGMGFLTGAVRDVEAGFTGKAPEVVAEEMRLRKQENPLASGAGQFAGLVAGTALTGGGAAVAKGAGLTGLKAAAAAGALEGGMMGLGSEVSESILENRPLVAEKLAMSGAAGALTGGGLGAAFHGAGAAVSSIINKTGAPGTGGALAKLADEAEWLALSLQNKKLAARNVGYKDEILKWGRKHGVLDTRTAAVSEENLLKTEAANATVGKQIGDEVARYEASNPLMGRDALRAELVTSVGDELSAKFAKSPVHKSAVNDIVKDLEEVLDTPNFTWQDVWRWQSDLYKKLPKDPNVTSQASQEVVDVTRDALRKFTLDTAEKVNPGAAAKMKNLAAEYHAGMSFEDLLRNRVDALRAATGPFGMSFGGSVTGGLIGSFIGGPVGGIAGTLSYDFLRKRGLMLSGTALRSISNGKLIPGMAAGLTAKIAAASAALSPAIRMSLDEAAGQGAEALLTEHTRIASGPEGPAYLQALGYQPEDEEQMSATSQRMAAIQAVEDATRAHDEAVDGAISGLLGTAPGRKGTYSSPKVDVAKKVEQLQNLVSDPDAFSTVPGNFQSVLPEVSGLSGQTLLNAAQFLLNKAPKNPHAGTPPALQPPWKPSAADTERWTRYIDAVERPMEVIKNMGQGVIMKEHVEALQAVYPAVYEELKEKLFERLNTYGKGQLDYKRRLAAAQFFGPQALGMTADQAKVLQQTHEAAGKPPGGDGSMKPPDGRQQIDAQKNSQTQAQRLEAR